eukprot:7019892-Pyramimonas_sp.AAC.1
MMRTWPLSSVDASKRSGANVSALILLGQISKTMMRRYVGRELPFYLKICREDKRRPPAYDV